MGPERMNLEFQRARRLAERCQWAEAEAAYESARDMAELIGATECYRQAEAFRFLMEANVRSQHS